MPKLIDADKLKAHYAWWDNEDKKIFDTIVDLQPDAVVRCKDCKYNYHNMIPSGEAEYGCTKCIELPITADFYCSWGERREDAETKTDRNGFVKQDDLFPQGR